VDPGYPDYLEMVIFGYLSPCYFSWEWWDWFHSIEHTLDLEEELIVAV